MLDESRAELQASREELIHRLSFAADHKGGKTASHIERVARYAHLLARRAGLSEDQCELVRLAAPMHDIGKIGLPDAVLCHPGDYDDEDRAAMHRHPDIGYMILQGSRSPVVQLAAIIALGHHEWFDGSGYPQGISGTTIPQAALIVAIADVFDALTTPPRHQPALSTDEARAVMEGERGHFDPQLLAHFFADAGALEAILHADLTLVPILAATTGRG
jgi:response regulator RpfG family c-di-GMP phosphodiesterase